MHDASSTIAHEWGEIQSSVGVLSPWAARIAYGLFQMGAASVLSAQDLGRKGPAEFFLGGVMAATNVLLEHLASAGSSDATLRARLAVLRDEVSPFASAEGEVSRRSVRDLAEALQPLLHASILVIGCVETHDSRAVTLRRAQVDTLRKVLADRSDRDL